MTTILVDYLKSTVANLFDKVNIESFLLGKMYQK